MRWFRYIFKWIKEFNSGSIFIYQSKYLHKLIIDKKKRGKAAPNPSHNRTVNISNLSLKMFIELRASPRAPFSCENVDNKKESLGNSLV